MRFSTGLLVVGIAMTADAQTQYTSTGVAAVAAAAATAKTLSPVSSIRGNQFDRFINIWLENTDIDMAAGDPSLQWVAKQGITLNNYNAITHPSQPNYVASVGGDTHWVWEDWMFRIDSDVRTIVDLLEDGGVSWGLYQEDMPYSGFEGNWVNHKTGANDYVRKHNPLMSYDSVTSNEDRLAKSKNFTMFYRDLEADTLPQWMFITPNMTNDGHDSSVTVAGAWTKRFLEPLLSNPTFMQNTLIMLTFDETECYICRNRVFSVLLGDVIPSSLRGTMNDTSFNHYSIMSTVEHNWDLGNLGLNDEKAPIMFNK
ncbi:phosphoesterase-domain-containing protein [Mollisia scopiformis]|uniref:Phosphoesterase-domain-containing protein n=1 Tax=Mollisia scopiformis TaxID=149040 RepID=A0A194WXE5_MOLSC|nr:phosphoesterase-domain-containing protein [Mollisia scopiformis]KUJ12359.1 phosphoesterase-domain-containing protein [Mollisia scopiformis]